MNKFLSVIILPIQALGERALLFYPLAASITALPRRFQILIKQFYAVGVLSTIIIVVSGLFVGMVMALQSYHTLAKFNATEAVGVVVLLSLTRELGPVITALLFAGRSGSALTAEIALMKATEQISSIEMIGVNPYHYVYGPRFFAALISLPILTMLFIMVGLWGGYMVCYMLLNIDSGVFWSSVITGFDFEGDFIGGMIKSLMFGVVCSWIAIVQGITSTPTPDGMSRATTTTVVYSSLAILGLDYVLTAMLFTT